MLPDALTLLSRAAKERRCAIIRYDGQHQIRAVEPHAIYTDASGNLVVECYQTRGYSETNERLPFWRIFSLRRIDSVFLLNIPFRARIEAGFRFDKPEYRDGLIAIVDDPVGMVRGPQSLAGSQMLLSQMRGWWWEVGSAIDRVLSAREVEWSPDRDLPREPREH